MSHMPGGYLAIATNYITGPNNSKMLAQVTLVDWRGQTNVYVRPTAEVVDYRSSAHGLDSRHMEATNARSFISVKNNVAEMIQGRVLVGHALWQSLALLGLTHPAVDTRDVATYTPFRSALGYSLDSCSVFPTLKDLMQNLMRRDIEPVFTNSAESARAAMDLFRSHRVAWEGVMQGGGWPCVVLPAYWNVYYT